MWHLKSQALIYLFAFAGRAVADSREPWPNQRVVDPRGQYYVVMKRVGGPVFSNEWGPVEFTVAERAQGTDPVKSATATIQTDTDFKTGGHLYHMLQDPDVSVRRGDKILGRGTLKRPPLQIVVSSSGLGFVGFDVWGYNYGYDNEGRTIPSALLVISKEGEVLHRKSLIDLFSEDELKGFNTTAGGMDWLSFPHSGWIRERQREIVVVGQQGDDRPNRWLMRTVDWKSGQADKRPTLDSREAVEKLQQQDSQDKDRRTCLPNEAAESETGVPARRDWFSRVSHVPYGYDVCGRHGRYAHSCYR